MDLCLLDTDIATEIFKAKNAIVAAHAKAYLRANQRLTVSAMTVFEIRRGLLFKKAAKQLAGFEQTLSEIEVLPIDDQIFSLAAELWAAGRQQGKAHNDADVLIAATAMATGRVLVTGNTPHFDWIGSLRVANWREA